MQAIQNLVLPSLDICSEEELYFRLLNSSVIYSYDKQRLFFDKGGAVGFDTYFNVFSVSSWKNNCEIDDLHLKINGSGKFQIRIMHCHLAKSTVVLHEKEIDLQESQPIRITIEKWSDITDGLLYVAITALSEAELYEINWGTDTKPKNTVRLGIVITHFNRKEYVVPAIKRISQYIENNSMDIQLIVVDNSQNITDDEGTGALVISNKNLGGSGGFMRGLLHLKDNSFTHCLFMDDDASCETESISRTYHLLAFAIDDAFAVAGGLLDEHNQKISLEMGSSFNGQPHLFKTDYDMTNVEHLIWSDIVTHKIDYSGWWFFAFKIEKNVKLTFPYFVKGDDITFAIDNKLSIISPLGVCCWGESFGLKSNPFSSYLWARFIILQPILYSNYTLVSSIIYILKMAVSFGLAGKYESVQAISQAVRDICKGPKFWIENIDTVDIRDKINSFTSVERMLDINLEACNLFIFSECHKKEYDRYGRYREPFFRKKFRMLSFQGHFLPKTFFSKNTVVLQEKSHGIRFAETFLFEKILHYDHTTGKGFITTHNNLKFWLSLFGVILRLAMLLVRHIKLKNSYRSKFVMMTSEKFWRDMLEIK